MIKNWKQFNESNENLNSSDLEKILDWVAENIPSSEIPMIKKDLKPLTESKVNEGVFQDIKDRLSKWFDEKILNYIVNQKKSFYLDLIGKLDLFDLTTLDDVKKHFRNFKLDSIYLAGGMDKAKDVGAGWRGEVEYEFEVANRGKKSPMDPIIIPHMGERISVRPAYVVDGINLDRFINEGGNKFVKIYYDTPAVLNPVRKEVDRTKNAEFAKEMGKFKSGQLDDTDNPRAYDEISRIFSKTIEFEDEIIVNMVDAVFVGFNESTSAGTFGELQQTSFLKKPMFAWYIGGWKISGHSPWTIPHISKIMRTDEDMKAFVKTMINYKNK
jgi:hypothetical protein